jgi:N-acetylneuraminic acid mutarotase
MATVPVAIGLMLLVPGAGGPTFGLAVVAESHASPAPFSDDALSFEERVRHQRAIEEVYWRHRIWPAENPGPKPALGEVLPETVLRERVATYLEQSAALELLWHRPVTGEQLQAELNRMVRNTRSPDLLRELIAALDNDPFLVAECLARPALVNRMIRNWYARDARFHGALRQRAETVLATLPNVAAGMSELGGEYREVEWRLAPERTRAAVFDSGHGEDAVIELDATEWREHVARLAEELVPRRAPRDGHDPSTLLDRIPTGRPSRLVEENDCFTVTAVLSKQPDRLRTATVTWSKLPFDVWWSERGRATVRAAGSVAPVFPPPGGYEMREPHEDGCTLDSWTATWYLPAVRAQHNAVWTGTEMIVWGGSGSIESLNSGGRYDPATETWTKMSTGSGVPTPRVGSTAVWTGTEMIVWGGEDGTGGTNSGGRYDPATDSWTETSLDEGVPTRRQGHTAVWTGTEMIVWGGVGYLNTGGRYNPATDSWTETSTGAGAPTGRSLHTAVWTGTEMIVWGGDDGAVVDTGGRYDPATDGWTPTSTGSGVARERIHHTAVWTGSEMIVWGGFDGGTNGWRVGGRYNPLTDSWTETPITDSPTGRRSHTAVWTGSEMIVWGGIGYENTGGRYDPAADRWTETSTGDGVPTGRMRHTAVWTGTEMIVWGGDGAPWRWNTGGKYDPVTDTWTATSMGAGVPAGRNGHSTVWTGTEMIVWGGQDRRHFNDGGRYVPATDSWTPTSTVADVPTKRAWHEAVWTGIEMIVWSGYDGAFPYTQTGGEYNPVTDHWIGFLGAWAPEGRVGHTAIWTGTEMIIWGGSNTSWPLNSGGRYDPETESWSATSTGANSPTPRNAHTAVWTGSEMIVWGGFDLPCEYQNTGGRYDPSTDSWKATSTDIGVPEGRDGHVAVWTGSEMIVWSGEFSNCCGTNVRLNSGGRYDPVSDSWTATPIGITTPRHRTSATAVWTGQEMIVWGGYQGGTEYDTGGRYDPASDSWTATSTESGVPTGRRNHTAVWTGSQMIVWGGTDGGSTGGAPNDVALYCACDGATVSTWYPDADGDGHGVETAGIPACAQPPGYVASAGDCDDSNPATFPGAAETNDGLDNQCPGEDGYGLVDEISGVCGFHNPGDRNEFSWPAQAGATSYEVARSTDPLFAADCLVVASGPMSSVDTAPVPPGVCFHYLVRSTLPNEGSWGADSSGAERALYCPPTLAP